MSTTVDSDTDLTSLMSAVEPASQKLSINTQLLLALVCSVAYFYAFQLNVHWFDWMEFSHGTNWVFLPSGLRLLFVLVLLRAGAIGIALGSVVVNYTIGNPDAHVFNIVTGLISGASPYIARQLAVIWFGLDQQLANVSGRMFFKLSVLFAAVNALTHQLWYFWEGHTQNFLGSTLAMAAGDWTGTVLVLATASFAIKAYQRIRPPQL
jgi:hypothetical protein